ncbi:RES domain-containing protein (plasmid) [Niallia circulans]|uniref:RES domain-containing protein n=1 Tax=Niallia circulans TaxID=1397 RepID=A0A553SQW6_NIACI|nr:RES family NAD+ phosphorylase [Niallia circulans]TRZ39384.1 RES domain-containing protein [Niallia circulans]
MSKEEKDNHIDKKNDLFSNETEPLKLVENPLVDAIKPMVGLNDLWKPLMDATKPMTELNDLWKPLIDATKPMTELNDLWKPLMDATKPITELNDLWKPLMDATKPMTELNNLWKPLMDATKPMTELNNLWKPLMDATKPMTELNDLIKPISLVVPVQTIDQYYSSVDNKVVSNIFKGISPDDYSIKSKINDNKINTLIVKSNSKEEIHVKSFVSTVGVVDLLDSISKEEAISFFLHLSSYPMLGGEHEIGRRIIDQLDTIKTITLNKHINLFRARPRDEKTRPIPYSQEEMFSAPFGLSKQGRYNVVGQGELYTCNNKEVAILECAKDKTTTVDVIEWELQETVKMIDLTDKKSPLVQYCSFSAETSSGLEYLVPNFIAQCAKSKGITGIVFPSTLNSEFYNYVFFDYQKKWFRLVTFHELLSAA